MSLLAYAKSHCANWLGQTNSCYLHEKISYEPDISVEAGECVLATGKPCDYFRKSVAPAAPTEIRYAYEKLDKAVIKTQARFCPDCSGDLKPRQRYCEKCTKKRKRQAEKKSREKRKNGSMSTQELIAI